MGRAKSPAEHADDRAAAKARKRRGRGASKLRQEREPIDLVKAGIQNRFHIERRELQEKLFAERDEANRKFAAEWIEVARRVGSNLLKNGEPGYYFIRGLIKDEFRGSKEYAWNETEDGFVVAKRR